MIGRGDRPLLVVLGNCQAESLRLLLDAGDVATVRLPALHELTAADVGRVHDLVRRADLVVSQPVRPDYRGLRLGTEQLRELARPDVRWAQVLSVRHAGLYPAHVVVHPPGLADPEPPVVAYHDVRTAVRAAWTRAGRRAPAPDPVTAEQLRAIGDRSVAELERREQAAGAVVVSDLLARPTFAHMRTINHPGNAVLEPLAARVRLALGLDPRPPAVTRPLLMSVHAPREAAVVRDLDPLADPVDHWIVEGRTVAVGAVASAQLAFYARRPDVLDVVLARSAWLCDLLQLERPGRWDAA